MVKYTQKSEGLLCHNCCHAASVVELLRKASGKIAPKSLWPLYVLLICAIFIFMPIFHFYAILQHYVCQHCHFSLLLRILFVSQLHLENQIAKGTFSFDRFGKKPKSIPKFCVVRLPHRDKLSLVRRSCLS